MANWVVKGTKHGKPVTVTVEAKDRNEAIRLGSNKHLLVVHTVRFVGEECAS